MATNLKRDDGAVLEMLELRDMGHTLGRIARKFSVTRGTVSGCLHRIDQTVDPARVQEGTMPTGWWREGLERR